MVIILLGPPGAGKGTQASRLARDYNLRLISMGDFLRNEVERDSSIGREVSPYLSGGELVPDEIIIRIVENLIGDSPKGIILDGFPRNLNQAQSLKRMLKDHPTRLVAIEITCSDREIIRRLSARRYCPKCQRIYNLITNPPKDDEICDDCKVSLRRRDDDREEVIRNRLSVYHRMTRPIIDYFRSEGEFYRVSGGIDEIYRELREIIDGDRSQVSR
ncbi:adenylate kinase [candidate division WOR-3 bacterium]|uniref:Adenylate kinase n=1 Tax=candidate division WOR-3 bacterium TaxID=2052148 RepID=A0A660SLC7_UNCW3|nr:MAG: adenylate kinase [candidate division WOR-3 bacterium]